MPEDVKTDQMDSPSANVEVALRSEKNVEYVWDDAIDLMVGYWRSKNAMMIASIEYEEFGKNMINSSLANGDKSPSCKVYQMHTQSSQLACPT